MKTFPAFLLLHNTKVHKQNISWIRSVFIWHLKNPYLKPETTWQHRKMKYSSIKYFSNRQKVFWNGFIPQPIKICGGNPALNFKCPICRDVMSLYGICRVLIQFSSMHVKHGVISGYQYSSSVNKPIPLFHIKCALDILNFSICHSSVIASKLTHFSCFQSIRNKN